MDEILDAFIGLHPFLLYLVLGVGAALENVVPPVPADTFILLGGFLAARGDAQVWTVFLVTWSANVASALLVYRAGYRYGRPFFQRGLGRRLLQPAQLARVDDFYRRWGAWAIFLTRFIPGLRAIVPAFAGVSRQRFLPVALPLITASGIWYGVLVRLGFEAGRNLDAILARLEGVNLALLGVAAVLAGAVALWWYRSRGGEDGG